MRIDILATKHGEGDYMKSCLYRKGGIQTTLTVKETPVITSAGEIGTSHKSVTHTRKRKTQMRQVKSCYYARRDEKGRM